VREQVAADAASLAGGKDVGVADEIDVADGLDAHHADQRAVALGAPEDDAGRDLALELRRVHVRLVPAVGRDHPAIGAGGGVHDREHGGPLVVATSPDRTHGREA
jgi:hypothetical protein